MQHTLNILLESESYYTSEQLKPKALRLDHAYIEEIARKYVQEDEDQ